MTFDETKRFVQSNNKERKKKGKTIKSWKPKLFTFRDIMKLESCKFDTVYFNIFTVRQLQYLPLVTKLKFHIIEVCFKLKLLCSN